MSKEYMMKFILSFLFGTIIIAIIAACSVKYKADEEVQAAEDSTFILISSDQVSIYRTDIIVDKDTGLEYIVVYDTGSSKCIAIYPRLDVDGSQYTEH